MLPDEVLQGLGNLLQESLARITQMDGSLPAGAGFFVSDSLLITNRHVVGEATGTGAQQVLVHPYGKDAVPGLVLPRSTIAPELDIALVRLDPEPKRQAVLLHRGLIRGDYVLAGYPQENFYSDLSPGAELSPPGTLKGTPRNNNQTKRPDLLRLSGYQIRPGHSGGPVLCASTGAVAAVTVFSENPNDNLGGGALPVELAIAAYPELEGLVAEPPAPAVSRYRDILGRTVWESLGLVWDPDRQVDIYLAGKRSSWSIGLRENDAGDQLTARDLGDDLTEVLVQWARSSGSRDHSEVLLLGRLLSAALFPEAVARQLPMPAMTQEDDPVLIRLHIDPGGPLADLPWELAIDPHDPERKKFLAATDGYAVVRVNPGASLGISKDERRTRAEQMTVLRVIVQPEDHTLWPQVVDASSVVSWPATQQIDADLASHISGPKGLDGSPLFVSETSLVNPTFADLADLASMGGADILHYVGFGYQEPEDGVRTGLERSWLAFSTGGLPEDLRYHRAQDVLSQMAALRPRLLIMQFGTPSPKHPYAVTGDNRCQPLGPALLEAADTLDVDGMVCARPMHPIQFDRFNRRIYSLLGSGLTLEQSVQLARRAVFLDQPVDYAGFGWFVMTTGNRLHHRYFERPTTKVREAGRLTHTSMHPKVT